MVTAWVSVGFSNNPFASIVRSKMRFQVSIIVPTYRRPEMLRKCVASLWESDTKPDEIILVGRQGDRETEVTIAQLQKDPRNRLVPIRAFWVTTPGHIPPVQKGVYEAQGEIVAIIDDDVTVSRQWLGRIVSHFYDDQRIGVVGGRVIVPGRTVAKLKGKPGQISWYGKHWGNIGAVDGPQPFEVSSVMECNWAWRRQLLASLEFDPVLNIGDASMYGMDLCLQAKAKGFKVVYDPQAVVYHHVAPRAPELDRANRPQRVYEFCHNYTYIMLKHLPWERKIIFLLWWFLIGGRGDWGLGALVADTFLHGLRWASEVVPAWRGKVKGISAWLTRYSRKGSMKEGPFGTPRESGSISRGIDTSVD
ncbi:MAG: glycosyltransferase family 2 protein [Thermofilaceae archaeon]